MAALSSNGKRFIVFQAIYGEYETTQPVFQVFNRSPLNESDTMHHVNVNPTRQFAGKGMSFVLADIIQVCLGKDLDP